MAEAEGTAELINRVTAGPAAPEGDGKKERGEGGKGGKHNKGLPSNRWKQWQGERGLLITPVMLNEPFFRQIIDEQIY